MTMIFHVPVARVCIACFMWTVVSPGVGGMMATSTFKLYHGYKVKTVLKTVNARSSRECAALCGELWNTAVPCWSATFNNVTSSCVLSNDKAVSSIDVSNASYTTIALQPKYWGDLLFRGTKGCGFDTGAAFIDGVGATSDDPDCKVLEDNGCVLHYRSSKVDNWETLNITQVRYSYYKDGIEEAYIVYNGTGTTVTSWFHPDNVIETSWEGWFSHGSFQYSSIHGLQRRFTMHVSFSGCTDGFSYGVNIVSGDGGCTFDLQSTYPQFMYSILNTAGDITNPADFDMADLTAIQVRYK